MIAPTIVLRVGTAKTFSNELLFMIATYTMRCFKITLRCFKPDRDINMAFRIH